jgi:hypothetical protein
MKVGRENEIQIKLLEGFFVIIHELNFLTI